MTTCLLGGSLVGRDGWLPTAPFDYRWPGLNQPPIGCNTIACGDCDARVRSIAGFGPGADFEPSTAYELDDPAVTEHLQADAAARLYFCRCRWTVVATSADLQHPELQHPRDFVSNWECAGHPPLPLPPDLEGERIDVAGDARRVVERRLRDLELPLPDDLRPGDLGLPSFWLLRLYRLLQAAAPPLAGAVATTVGQFLLDPDPLVRFGAVCFIWAVPDAEGGARLGPAVAERPELFEGPVRHWDLGLQTTGALLNRLAGTGDPAALEGVKAIALRPGAAERDVLFALAQADRAWLLAHALPIAAGTPAQVESLVYLLRSSPADVLTDLLVGMAGLDGVGSATVRRAAERHLDDEVTERAAARLGPP